MAKPNFKTCLEETLTRAFACENKKTRLLYLQLADFYEKQAQLEALRERGLPVQIFR